MAPTGATLYGVTPYGFYAKPLPVIQDEIDEGLKAILGQSAGTEPDGSIPLASAAGQLKAFLADGFAAQWDLQEAGYAARDPSAATDDVQDRLCELTGTLRQSEAQSAATGTCVGNALTVLQIGRVATVQNTGARFASATGATLALASAWAALSAYTPGQRVANSGNVYQCTASGTTAATIGPSGPAQDITDGTAHWRFLGAGSGVADVLFLAESVGPVGALAGALNAIATPVDGWNVVVNLLDADVGRNKETNAALRARRDAELAGSGNTTVDAIRANVLKVNEGSTDPNHTPPTAVKVFFNDTDAYDANGLPPHSVEVLVQDGTDADIVQEIWDSVGAGTRTYGNTSGTATDSEGNEQTVYYTRPTPVLIYVSGVVRYEASAWPAGSDSAVAQASTSALLTYTATWPIERDVRRGPLEAAILRGPSEVDGTGSAIVPASEGAAPVAGLLEVEPLYFGTSTGPTGNAQLSITSRQIAVFDSTRTTLTASTEDP